jgi:hypothetical protein
MLPGLKKFTFLGIVKMRMKNLNLIPGFLLLGLFWLLLPQAGIAQQNFKRLGKSGFSFLKIAPSARAAALGDAYTALATDAYAMFWNPAGLTNIDKFAYGFSYGKWLVNSNFMSAAVGFKHGVWALGLSAIGFSPEEFEETTISAPEGTGRNVTGGDVALGAAVAIQFTNKLSFGFKTNWIEETIDRDKASGFLVDFSTFYRTGFRNLVLAMSMKNFGPEQKFINEEFKMPLIFNINTAMSFIGQPGAPLVFTVSTESSFATDYRDRYHVGAELWLLDVMALRGGYKFYYDLEDFSAGVGLKFSVGDYPVTVDVAYTHVVKFFDAPLRFSIGGAF